MNKPKVVLLHGAGYFNVGDLGIVDATIERLREELGEIDLKLVDPYADRVGMWHRIHGSPIRGFKTPLAGAQEIPDFVQVPLSRLGMAWALLRYAWLRLGAAVHRHLGLWLPRTGFLRELAWGDIIISRGGGFLLDSGGVGIIRAHLLTLSLATKTGKPVVIYAQSIGPFKRKLGARLTARVMNQMALITVREPLSMEIVKGLRLTHPRVELTADEAFLLPMLSGTEKEAALATAGLKPGPLRVGVAPVPWHFPLSVGGVDHQGRYLEVLADTINWLIEERGAEIYLNANVEAPNGRSDRTFIDEQLLPKIRRREKTAVLPALNARQLKTVIGELDLFFGTRMHANIFALGAGVPTLAISYLPKTAGIMQMLGLQEYVFAIDNMTSTDVRDAARKLLDGKEDVRLRIRAGVDDMARRARRNAELVRDLMQAKNRSAP
jgi:colanic acid/amylovoran biosynthesis protein